MCCVSCWLVWPRRSRLPFSDAPLWTSPRPPRAASLTSSQTVVRSMDSVTNCDYVIVKCVGSADVIINCAGSMNLVTDYNHVTNATVFLTSLQTVVGSTDCDYVVAARRFFWRHHKLCLFVVTLVHALLVRRRGRRVVVVVVWRHRAATSRTSSLRDLRCTNNHSTSPETFSQ